MIKAKHIDAGLLTFAPAANANGTAIQFRLQRQRRNADSASTYTMTVDVTAQNDLPTAGSNTVTTNEDTSYTFAAGGDFNSPISTAMHFA